MNDKPKCDRCGRENDVRCLQQRVAGRATQFREAIEQWCMACRVNNRGTYRLARETEPRKPSERAS